MHMPIPSSKKRDRDRGAQLQNIRKELGLSQSQVAKKIGVTPQTVRNMEKGEGWNQIDKLSALCNCLGINIDQLSNIDKVKKSEENSNPETIDNIIETPPISKEEIIDVIREFLGTKEAQISESMVKENIESHSSEV
ncbi:MAG: helix-turn-helix transcriptional regulator [Bacteroidota bacterium]